MIFIYLWKGSSARVVDFLCIEQIAENAMVKKTEMISYIKISENFKVFLLVFVSTSIVLVSALIENGVEKSVIYYNPAAVSDSFVECDTNESFIPDDPNSGYEYDENTSDSKIAEETEILFPIDVNLVTFEELCAIDGIGEKTADKIIEYRNSVGKITSLEQLGEIYGIGDKTIEKLYNYLYVAEEDYIPYVSESSSDNIDESSSEDIGESSSLSNTTSEMTDMEYISESLPDAIDEPDAGYDYVHINYADAEEISRCLKLRIDIAEDIVQTRNEIIEYQSIDELFLVESLSQSQIIEIMDYVIID